MSAAPAEVLGGGFDELLRGAELTRRGVRVDVLEPGLHAGAPYRTESFLTPFRFNLGPALVPRASVAPLRVLEPDPLLAVGDAVLGRDPHDVPRALLLALGLLLGIDPDAPGSGERLAAASRAVGDLVAVEGGNGLAVASLVDEIVAGGGRVVEGMGEAAATPPARPGTIGVCRLFVGLRRRPPAHRAFAEAVGFTDEHSLEARLRELRAGVPARPVGFLLSNAHLDPARPGDLLGSFVWQGLLPAASWVDRRAYTDAVLAAAGVARDEVLFSLLWLPSETAETLG